MKKEKKKTKKRISESEVINQFMWHLEDGATAVVVAVAVAVAVTVTVVVVFPLSTHFFAIPFLLSIGSSKCFFFSVGCTVEYRIW